MSTLLTIPRELRDKILFFAITSCFIPPEKPDHAENRSALNDTATGRYYHGDNIKYLKTPYTITVPSLLVNQQLRRETLAVIALAGKLPDADSYKLDVMIYKGSQLRPTWLYVPKLTRQVNEVYASFRLHGTGGRGFQQGSGGPPTIAWTFLALLERFLKVGPAGPQTEQRDMRIGIKTLIIDVCTPDVPEEVIAPEDRYERGLPELRTSTRVNYIVNPRFVAKFLADQLKWLVMMVGEWAEYGKMLYEGVGLMKVMHDGEVIQEWNLAERYDPKLLAGTDSMADRPRLLGVRFCNVGPPRRPREVVEPEFIAWKIEAYKKRQDAGLECFPKREEIVSLDQLRA